MRLGLGLGIPYSLGGPKAAAFSPLDLSPTLWLDASDTSTITEVGGAVSQWDDKSGNGWNVVQATAANQPTSGTRTLNSLNVLDFDGNDLLDVDFGFGNEITQPNTIFMVVQIDTTATNVQLFDGVDASDRQFFGALAAGGVWRMSAGTVLSGGSQDQNAHILTVIFNGASSSLDVDSANVLSGNAGANDLGGVTLGATYAAASGLNGAIAEVIVVDGTLTAGEISDTETYLANKWGITI